MDLAQSLDKAVSKGGLCLTVPWVVQYMSMIDSQISSSAKHCSVLTLLIHMYRSALCVLHMLNIQCVIACRSLADSNHSSTWFFLVCNLGWLFEVVAGTECFSDCQLSFCSVDSKFSISTVLTESFYHFSIIWKCTKFFGEFI